MMKTRSQATKFLDFPSEIKAQIFQYLDGKDRLQLRKTCSEFKGLIDNYVGISTRMKNLKNPLKTGIVRKKKRKSLLVRKIAFFKSLCIRDVFLTNVKLGNFLRYPNYLNKVNIGSDVDKEVITSILRSCPNLKELQMISLTKQALHSKDFVLDNFYLSKLETLTVLSDPIGSLPQWSQAALNILQILQHIKAANLKKFYVDTFITPYSHSLTTMEVLLMFLYNHRHTLKTIVIGVNHMLPNETSPLEMRQMKELAQKNIQPLFQNTQLEQKSITFSNIKDVEFTAFYPFICAQSQLEKLTVTNWNGATQNWVLYEPIFLKNYKTLTKLHLSVECSNPFDFRILKDCHGLLELALFVQSLRANVFVVNGIHLSGLPVNLELLILSNVLIRTEELDYIPKEMKKLKIFALVQIGGMPCVTNGMRLITAKKILHMRSLEAVLLCGICTPFVREKTSLRRMTLGLTGREDFFIITEPNQSSHKYWTITRQEETFTANLSFHLQIRY